MYPNAQEKSHPCVETTIREMWSLFNYCFSGSHKVHNQIQSYKALHASSRGHSVSMLWHTTRSTVEKDGHFILQRMSHGWREKAVCFIHKHAVSPSGSQRNGIYSFNNQPALPFTEYTVNINIILSFFNHHKKKQKKQTLAWKEPGVNHHRLKFQVCESGSKCTPVGNTAYGWSSDCNLDIWLNPNWIIKTIVFTNSIRLFQRKSWKQKLEGLNDVLSRRQRNKKNNHQIGMQFHETSHDTPSPIEESTNHNMAKYILDSLSTKR